MKKVFRLLAVVMAVALVGVAFASCTGSGSDSKPAGDNTDSAAETQAEKQDVDFSKPDLVIEADDFKAMQSLMEDASMGNYDGKVVKITGTSEKFGSSYSIMESDNEGTGVGMTYKLVDSEEYPADYSTVTLTGVIVEGEYGARYIEVLSENIVVAE